MEQEEDFKRVVAILKELEQSNLSGDDLEKQRDVAIHSIEVEFEKCMNALATRKQALLREVELKFQEQKKQLDSQEHNIKTAIKGCKEALQAGSTLYSLSREATLHVWKGAVLLKPKTAGIEPIAIKFAVPLVETIATHGSVGIKETGFTELSRAGAVSTLAGSIRGSEDGRGDKAKIFSPYFGCLNPIDDCFYFTEFALFESVSTIRKVTRQGDVTTFIGRQLSGPCGIDFSVRDNCFYIIDDDSIKKIAEGKISVLLDGRSGELNSPSGLTVDQKTGNLFVTDTYKHLIRKITPQGEVSTVAGTGTVGNQDGKEAAFNYPYGMCCYEKEQKLVVCDTGNSSLRMIDLQNGEVTTICQVTKPQAIAITPDGAFIVSSQDHRVYLVTLTNGKHNSRVIAGSGTAGFQDGDPLNCKFDLPIGVAFDPKTNACLVIDHINCRIRSFALIK